MDVLGIVRQVMSLFLSPQRGRTRFKKRSRLRTDHHMSFHRQCESAKTFVRIRDWYKKRNTGVNWISMMIDKKGHNGHRIHAAVPSLFAGRF